MVLQSEALFGEPVSQVQPVRAFPYEDGIMPGTLDAAPSADRDLPNLSPLFYDDAAGFWSVWEGQSNEVNTITSNATPATAGTFTLTFQSEVTDPIAFDATAAAVQAALEANANVLPGDVVAVQTSGTDLGDASAVVTLTWGGQYAGQNIVITLNATGLTGNAHVLATSTQGGSNASDGSAIDGFLWSPLEAHEQLLAGETLVQVFRNGLIHVDDIPVPDGESQSDLNEALLASSLREKGINLQGLPGFH